MKMHEYQAKQLFRKNGIPVPDGSPTFNVDQACKNAEELEK